jgi:hypothetical protein
MKTKNIKRTAGKWLADKEFTSRFKLINKGNYLLELSLSINPSRSRIIRCA